MILFDGGKSHLAELDFARLAIMSARFIGFCSIFPMFTWVGVNGLLRFAIAGAFAAPLIASEDISFGSYSVMVVTTLIIKELMLGSLLGLALGTPVWLAQATGDLIDLYRGASAPDIFDPVHAVSTSPFGKFNATMAIGWLASSGFFLILLQAIYDSFKLWPATAFIPATGMNVLLLISESASFMGLGSFVVGAPILTALALSELTLLVVTRSARSLNTFDLSSSVKSAVFIACLPLYSLFFSSYFSEQSREVARRLFAVLGLR